jgi:BON domain
MLRRVKFVLPFAVAGLVCLAAAGSQVARAQGTNANTGSRSTGSTGSTSMGSTGATSLGSVGLGTIGLGTTTSSGNGNPLGSTSSSTSVAGTSLFGPYVGEPLGYGLPSANANGTFKAPTFGQPLYSVNGSSSTTSGRGTATGRTGTTNTGTASVRSGTASTTSTFNGATAFRANAAGYTTQIKFAFAPPPSPAAVRADLMQAIGNLSEIPSRAGVNVVIDGDTVVLRGKVDTGEERRIVESLVRLSPGVNQVRNELEAQRPAE